MATARSTGTPPWPAGAVLALLWALWVLAPAGLVLVGMGQLLTFFGETPSEAERDAALGCFGAAAAVAAVVPLLGLWLSVRGGRRGFAATFAIASVVGLAAAGTLIVLTATADRADAPAGPGPDSGQVCQEHSGGDNRCPGG